MLHILKKTNPNLYIIIVAIATAMWFQGINFIINIYVSPTLRNGILLSLVSLFIFYMDDYSLSELYNYEPKKKDNLIRHASATINNN